MNGPFQPTSVQIDNFGLVSIYEEVLVFGSGKRKAVSTATQNLVPLVGIFQQYFGIPVGFWQSPFVLGFFWYLIGGYLKLSSQGRLSSSEMGYALVEVFANLSNINGDQLARRCAAFVYADVKDEGFEKGVANATPIWVYMIDALKDEDNHPEIVSLKQQLPNADRGTILGLLFQSLFISEVQKRLHMD